AVGIEALSRGASEVTFVEKSRAAIAVIHSNLSRCGFEGRARVIGADVVDLLRRGDLARSEEHTSELQSRFDLVCRLQLEKKNSRIALRVHTEPLQPPPASRRDRSHAEIVFAGESIGALPEFGDAAWRGAENRVGSRSLVS